MQNWQYVPLSHGGRTVILDTDIGPDCDDAGALALLMAYRRRFSFPVAGIVNCTANPWANGAIRAITRFLGEELPVAQANAGDLLADAVKFDRPLSEKYLPDPASGITAPASADVYLEALERAADDSVVIVSIGQFTAVIAGENVNIANMTNKSRGDYAYTLIDINQAMPHDTVERLKEIEGVLRVRRVTESH